MPTILPRRTPRVPEKPVAPPQPMLLAVALAAAFAAATARAQPSGATSVHGTASVSQHGATTTVITTNGAGTNHSVTDWRSFSIPAGTATKIHQPHAGSTSINRVTGPDPSAIFGSLWSNGRVVLVNPAGITVGAGAVVDTAGFTASALRMSDADAVAGRLRFGDGLGEGALRVEEGSQVLARGGDVVLIGSNVQVGAGATVRSEGGAVVLAAGKKAEITGRGLEGIRLEVQAPADQAVNLGRLGGDAVGIFAGTLRHSGLVTANSASVEGGRVVLRTVGDAIVDGQVQARRGGQGGSIDVFGTRVGLQAGARLDASGSTGDGGSIRVGGDFQGKNAEVPNAQRTYVDKDAVLLADAGQAGDGGRVIVWADQSTRAYGTISARGGAQSGDGGFVEVSGKHGLDFAASVDTRAPNGQTGTLLLDPDNITVVAGAAALPSNLPDGDQFSDPGTTLSITNGTINAATTNVVLQANNDIDINANINIADPAVSFTAQAGNNLNVNADITTAGADITLVAGALGSPTTTGTAYLSVGGNVTSNGGNITLHTQNNGANEGIVAVSGGATVDSGGGDILLRADKLDAAGNGVYVAGAVNAGNGALTATSADVWVDLGGSVARSGAGDLVLHTDQLRIDGNVNGGTGRVVVRNQTDSQSIQLGVASKTGGQLDLTAAELNRITAGTLVAGWNTQMAAIHIAGNIAPTSFTTLSLITNGAITQAGAIGLANLNADGGSVTLTNTGNTVSTLSGYGRAGNFDFRSNAANLTVGTVDGQNGVSATGTATITGNGAVTVAKPVSGSTVTITGQTGVNIADSVNATAGAVQLNAAGAGANLVFNPLSSINVYGTAASMFTAGGAVNFSSGLVRLNRNVASTQALNIAGGSVGIDGTVQLQNVNLSSGAITNGGPADNLTIAGTFNWSGGSLLGNNTAVLAGTTNVTGSVTLSRALQNIGTLNMSGAGFISQTGAYAITNDGVWDIQNTSGGGVGAPLTGSFVNNNLLKLTGGSTGAAITAGTVTNGSAGTIAVVSGTLLLGMGSGSFNNSGVLDVYSGATVSSSASGFNNLAAGKIIGSGTIDLSGGSGTLNNSGTIDAGGAANVGTLTLNGNLNQSGTLKVDVNGASHDQLAVSGSMNFNPGSLVIVNELAPPPDGTYVIVSGAMPTGTLPSLSGGPTGASLQFGSLQLVVGAAPAPAPSAPAAPAPSPTTTQEQAAKQQLQAAIDGIEDKKKDEDREPGRDDIVVTGEQCKPT